MNNQQAANTKFNIDFKKFEALANEIQEMTRKEQQGSLERVEIKDDYRSERDQ